MADAGPLILPPSYSNIDGQAARGAGSELKQSFESLKTEHNDIQELFRTVKAQLQNTPEIGEYHPLIEKWDELRVVRLSILFSLSMMLSRSVGARGQRHKRIFRDSQQNASMCSRFLKSECSCISSSKLRKTGKNYKVLMRLPRLWRYPGPPFPISRHAHRTEAGYDRQVSRSVSPTSPCMPLH